MSKQGWQETLISSTADGAALVSSTTTTSILPAQAKLTLPANFFSEVGKMLRITATGRYGSGTASTGTINFQVNFGTLATPIIVFDSGVIALNTGTIAANSSWKLRIDMTCRAIGGTTSANMLSVGEWVSRASLNESAVGTTQGVFTAMLPDTAPAAGTGFDSTITNVVDLFAKFSVSSANQTILCHQYMLESLN